MDSLYTVYHFPAPAYPAGEKIAYQMATAFLDVSTTADASTDTDTSTDLDIGADATTTIIAETETMELLDSESPLTAYIDVDVFHSLQSAVSCVSIGFALTTLLILLTYGAFKAISLIRIKY